VSPVFFAALIGSLDGGLLMFSANAVNHATGLGMIVLAQEGNISTADTDAVSAIISGGFSSTGFAKVDEVDIYLVNINANGTGTQDTSSCGGSACLNRYRADGTIIGTVVWAPTARSTASSNLTNIGLTLKAHYNYLAVSSASLSITQTRYFRLEPQT
jgi:Flp pilus assembly protein TadG